MTNEIAIADIREMSATMAKSGLFGKTPDQMMSLMLIAQAEGLHPAVAAMEYDIIQNRPSLRGQAALARFQQCGGKIQWLVRTEAEAKAKFSHPQGGELTVSWTMEKAQKMNLTNKDNWKKQPGTMLSWRCVAEGVRAVYPACLNKMYLSEEVQDFEPLRNVTPEPEYLPVIENKIKPAEKIEDIPPAKTENTEPVEKTAEVIALEKRAGELTEKAGMSAHQKAVVYNAVGKDLKKYCDKVERNITDKIVTLKFDLNEFLEDDNTSQGDKAKISAVLNSGEPDIKTLSAILDEVNLGKLF